MAYHVSIPQNEKVLVNELFGTKLFESHLTEKMFEILATNEENGITTPMPRIENGLLVLERGSMNMSVELVKAYASSLNDLLSQSGEDHETRFKNHNIALRLERRIRSLMAQQVVKAEEA